MTNLKVPFINSKRLSWILLLLLLPLSACQEDSNTVDNFPGKTVLAYMIADNSLSSEAQVNIDSLKAGFGRNTAEGNLLIYVDRSDEVPQLIRLVKAANGTVTQQIIKTYAEQNSVSSTVMASVLKDMTDRYPSTSYGLVLWSHGYGWLPAATTTTAKTTAAATSSQAVSLRWFGLDGTNKMDIPDLLAALSAGPHFDYILFDACFMGGVETAYALRNYTDYLIVSPTESLADGFPYSEMVPSMLGSTESDYIRMASLDYEHYSVLNGYNCSVAVSCIKCSELEALASQTKALICAHAANLDSFDISLVQHLESYSPHLFYDFGDFVKYFTTETERHSFEQQLEKTVVYKACTNNILSANSSSYYVYFPVEHFSGLSTYIPSSLTATRNASYQTLEWYTAVGWGKTKW